MRKPAAAPGHRRKGRTHRPDHRRRAVVRIPEGENLACSRPYSVTRSGLRRPNFTHAYGKNPLSFEVYLRFIAPRMRMHLSHGGRQHGEMPGMKMQAPLHGAQKAASESGAAFLLPL